MIKAKRFWFGAALAAAAVVVAVAAVLLLLHSAWFHEKVRQRIVQEVERATGGRAEIGQFRFDPQRLHAEVSRFVLHGKESPAEPPLFSAGSIGVDFRILSFVRRDIVLTRVALERPELNITVYPDGSTNLPEPAVKRERRGPVQQFLALAIRYFQIREGLVRINERRLPVELSGENLAAQLFYHAQDPHYSGQLSFRKLHAAAAGRTLPAFDADLTLTLDERRLRLQPAKFASRGSSLEAEAVLENLLAPRIQASFDAYLEAQEWFPPANSAAVSGKVRLTGEFSLEDKNHYSARGNASAPSLFVQASGVRTSASDVAAQFQLAPDRLELRGLRLSTLGGTLRGAASLLEWKSFRWSGQAEGISLAALARLRNIQADSWQGSLSGPVEVQGEITPKGPARLKAAGTLTIQATAADRPVEGFLAFAYDQGSAALQLRDSWLSSPATKLHFDGTLQNELRLSAATTDLADVAAAASLAGAALPSPLPVRLQGGTARFDGSVYGDLSSPRIRGSLSASNLSYEGHIFERLQAAVEATKDSLQAGGLNIVYKGARLEGSARIGLTEWKAGADSPIRGSFRLRGLSLEPLLEETGRKVDLHGLLNGDFQLAGTVGAPRLSGQASLDAGEAYGLKLDAARASLLLDGRTLTLGPIQLQSGKARLQGRLAFESNAENWRTGTLRFEIAARDWKLSQLRGFTGVRAAVDGEAALTLEGEAAAAGQLRLTLLHGTGSVRNVTIEKRPAGQLDFSLETQGDLLELTGSGKAAGAPVNVRARARLHGDYPAEGELRFGQIALSTLYGLRGDKTDEPLPLELFADGKVLFSTQLLKPEAWKAEVELPVVILQPQAGEPNGALRLTSAAPVRISVNPKQASIQRAQFSGAGGSLEASGRLVFGSRGPQYDLRMIGNVNLEVLRNFDRNITASGASEVDLSLRGPLRQPDLYGRLRLKDASVYLRGIPNGIDGANGEIFLFRDRATIERLTARTGGGTVSLSGFIGFASERPFYQIKALARQVRVRYPEGISTTFDATLELRGTAQRSLLTGSASVIRSSISPNLDFASVFGRPAQPFAPPASPNELLSGMQLDVSVTTAPNARFENSLARNLQAEADLRIQGTPYKPVLLGRISVNQGEINFLGNRYRISRGDITFANPFRVEPLLDLDLNTRVRGIEVTMNFSGPVDKLNVTYRSDPPLQVNEIIALLAVGRTPSSDPAVLARQTQADQSWQQIGASTLIGAAFETLEGGRLQRFFGVSRIKIDPNLTGLSRVPEAQITLEQQVSRDITFTYVTNLAQEQQQLVRVEWNLSRQWSLLAVRDENGLFSLEVQFRRQFR